jgi:hypothetical protein
MMDLLGPSGGTLNTGRHGLNGSRNTNSSFRLWWLSLDTTAAEQYDGTTWTINGIFSYCKIKLLVAAFGTQASAALAAGNYGPGITGSNRRMDRCSYSYKNNNGKLIWQNI